MFSVAFAHHSLKTRITLTTLAIFVTSIWLLAFYTGRMLREDMERLVGDQQFSTASFMAAQVNQELVSRLGALEKVAASLTSAVVDNAAALQATLEQRPVFQILFNGGVYATRLDGTVIADAPLATGRVGANYMDTDHLIGPLRAGKATIGRPIMGRTLRAPLVTMAVPIRDSRGEVIGALAGVTDLSQPNFLDKIADSQYGKTGGYILIAAKYRLIVTASDKRRIMQPLADPGVVPQTDRFVQGFEGYAVYVNPRGEEVLNSSKRIPVAEWNMGVTMPTAEAFAPIYAMQRRMLLATVLLTLAAAGLTWWMLRRQLAPMIAAARTLAAQSNSDQPMRALPVARQDEIGELVGGFNQILETLGQREADLLAIQRNLSAAQNIAHIGSWELDLVHDRLTWSEEMYRIFGMPPEEFGADYETFLDTLHPDDRAMVDRAYVSSLEEGGRYDIQYRILRKSDGELRWGEARCEHERDASGKALRSYGTVQDITERKQMEDQVRQLAFYDPLTKLPNRRLLNDRLSQTLAANKRSGCYGALMFLDLDNFKPLNDIHGHEVGDLLLIDAAERLKGCVREMDTVARFGGDEFVVMISELAAGKAESMAQAGIIAEKIRGALANPFVLRIQHKGNAETTIEHHCTASIGVALFINHEASQDDIIKWADTAMYQAKEAGRNSIKFWDQK